MPPIPLRRRLSLNPLRPGCSRRLFVLDSIGFCVLFRPQTFCAVFGGQEWGKLMMRLLRSELRASGIVHDNEPQAQTLAD